MSQTTEDLITRLDKCRDRLGAMCSESRPPQMSIPPRGDDDDEYIDATLVMTAAALTSQATELARLTAENADLLKTVEEGVGYVHESMRMVIQMAERTLPEGDEDRETMVSHAKGVIEEFRYIPLDHPDAPKAIEYRETAESQIATLAAENAELWGIVEEIRQRCGNRVGAAARADDQSAVSILTGIVDLIPAAEAAREGGE